MNTIITWHTDPKERPSHGLLLLALAPTSNPHTISGVVLGEYEHEWRIYNFVDHGFVTVHSKQLWTQPMMVVAWAELPTRHDFKEYKHEHHDD